MTEPLAPDFKALADTLVREIMDPHEPILSGNAEAIVEQVLRQTWETETVACETIVRVSGDEEERRGRTEKAEAAWAAASRIRLRRERILKREG